MRDRNDRREIVIAQDGWPVPEMIGGAVTGALVLPMFVALTTLYGTVPDSVSMTVGALIGAGASYLLRPRRLVASARRLTPEEEHLTRAA